MIWTKMKSIQFFVICAAFHCCNGVYYPNKDYLRPYFKTAEKDKRRATKISNENVARCSLFGCSVVYGSGYVVTRHLLQAGVASEFINCIRFFVAAMCFLRPMLTFSQIAIGRGIELGILCATGFIAHLYALKTASTAKASFFCSMSVLFPPFYDLFWHSKRRGQNVVVNVLQACLAIVGASVLEWGGLEKPKMSDVALLITPICFSYCLWKAEESSRRYPQETQRITGFMLLTTSLISLGCFTLECLLSQTPIDWKANASLLTNPICLLLLLYSGIVVTGWTAIAEQQSMKTVSATELTLIYSLEPIFATLFAYFLLDERITLNIAVGSGLILLACLFEPLQQLFSVYGKYLH